MDVETVNGTPMTIGQLSRSTGVPIKTLRDYADGGLIYTLGRSPAGYRLFDTDALWCIRQIGQLRSLGLTISEIHQLCRTHLGQPGPQLGQHLAQLLNAAKARIEERIAALQQTRERIERFQAEHAEILSGTCDDGLFTDDPRACDEMSLARC